MAQPLGPPAGVGGGVFPRLSPAPRWRWGEAAGSGSPREVAGDATLGKGVAGGTDRAWIGWGGGSSPSDWLRPNSAPPACP